MEGSNLSFLIQSQASYHWTNPQLGGLIRYRIVRLTEPGGNRGGGYKAMTTNPTVLTGQNGVKTRVISQLDIPYCL